MAEKPKPDLERDGLAAKRAARPSADPHPEDARPPAEASPESATPDAGGAQSPEELATRAAEEHVTRQRLPSVSSKRPDAIVLTGFLGVSGRAGYRRLYLDVTLKDYVEIPNDDVRHLEWVGAEQSVFGRKATLWVRRGATLKYTTGRP